MPEGPDNQTNEISPTPEDQSASSSKPSKKTTKKSTKKTTKKATTKKTTKKAAAKKASKKTTKKAAPKTLSQPAPEAPPKPTMQLGQPAPPPTPSSSPKPPITQPQNRAEPRKGPFPPGSRPEKKLPVNPRRVRGGLKPKKREGEPSWVAQRIMRLVEEEAPTAVYSEGLEYAPLGQTKRFEIENATVTASVQGRRTRPYAVELKLNPFDHEQADKIIQAMADQARYAANLLSGEVPRDIEDLFAPLGLQLFPKSAADFTVTCTCKEEKDKSPWCKHAVCTAALLADRLTDDPFLVFALRGLPGEELLERLRMQRTLGTGGPEPMPVYEPRVTGASDTEWPALDAELERFWDQPAGLEAIDLPIDAPDVSHPLLRRLGASPFEGRFPMVGLLATCYDLISERVRRDIDQQTTDAAGPNAEDTIAEDTLSPDDSDDSV